MFSEEVAGGRGKPEIPRAAGKTGGFFLTFFRACPKNIQKVKVSIVVKRKNPYHMYHVLHVVFKTTCKEKEVSKIKAVLLTLLGIFILYWVVLAVMAACVNPHREYDRNSRFYRNFLNFSTAITLWGARVHVHREGFEKLPSEAPVLFVSNHRSNFDPIITWYELHRFDLAFISKEENFHIPLFGRIVRRCAFLSIDRKNPRNAVRTMKRAVNLLDRQEVSIGLYPEGTRSRTGELLPFHHGLFRIAVKAKVPVVVAVLEGTEQVKRHFPLRRTDVRFAVLRVFRPEEYAGKSTEEIGEMIREVMLQGLQQTDVSAIKKKQSQ